jgi:hypothetical protein
VTAFLLLLLLQSPAPQAEVKSEWFPEGLIYRHPLADPRAPVSGVQFQFPIDKDDDMRIENRIATHLAVWRERDGDSEFEVQAEGAAFGRFDFQQFWDMEAVDFRFGFPIIWRRDQFAFKLHPWHMTSHLGDEFIERTGRKRVNYSRNELTIGVSCDLDTECRVYGEVGYAIWRGDVNDYVRVMAGFETMGRHLGADWPDVFAAVNVTSFQEQDWGLQVNVEAGVWLRPQNSPRGVRLSLGYFRGPSALTQFLEENEEHWNFGVALPF